MALLTDYENAGSAEMRGVRASIRKQLPNPSSRQNLRILVEDGFK